MGVFTRPVPRDKNDNIIAAPYREPRALTAAAARVDLSQASQIEALRKRRAEDTWQSEAWEYYDLIGELKFAANLIAANVSRVRLFPAVMHDDELAPSNVRDDKDVDPEIALAAQQALRLLATGNGGLSGLLKDAALNIFVAGECYLVQQPKTYTTPESWQVRSVDEIVSTTGRNKSTFIKSRRNARKEDMIELPKNAFMGRVWNTHPRYSDEADSSLRGILELLDELLLLNKSSRKTLKSRLNAGFLLMPDDMDNIAQSDGDVDDNTDTYAEDSDDNSDSFIEELITAMTTPIQDEGSASAVVPMVIRGPADVIDKIKHITIEQTFDPHHSERADKVLNRILAALDLPKEVVAGVADSKYANAVVIEEAMYKSHIEPLILLIVDALTVVFLRPVLTAMGYEADVVSQMVVWYDPSPITTKPSKAEAANTGYENKTLSAKAWRKHNGFSEDDAPTSLELGQRMAVERGLISEPINDALLRLLIPEIMDKVREELKAQSPDASSLDEVINNNQATEPTTNEEEPPEPPVELLEP